MSSTCAREVDVGSREVGALAEAGEVGVKTSWPRAAQQRPHLLPRPAAGQAPCTTTNVDIVAALRHRRCEAGHKRAPMSTRRDRSDLAKRAVFRRGDDDDLGRRGALPGEGEDVLAVGDDEQRRPARASGAATARPRSRSDARCSPRTKAFANAGSTSTRPSAASVAVSMQRHQGELRTRSIAIRSSRSRAPTARDWARPRSLRLRCVAQSSRRQPGGSPMPGSVAVAHQGDDAALAQRRPRRGFVGPRRRGGGEERRRGRGATRLKRATSAGRRLAGDEHVFGAQHRLALLAGQSCSRALRPGRRRGSRGSSTPRGASAARARRARRGPCASAARALASRRGPSTLADCAGSVRRCRSAGKARSAGGLEVELGVRVAPDDLARRALQVERPLLVEAAPAVVGPRGGIGRDERREEEMTTLHVRRPVVGDRAAADDDRKPKPDREQGLAAAEGVVADDAAATVERRGVDPRRTAGVPS